MKFLVAFAFCLVLQSALALTTASGDSKARTSCSYFRDTLTLSCKGPSGKVECAAIASFPMTFKIVGLGIDPAFTGKDIFRVYPLRQDSSAWINHQFLTTAQTKISLSVHASAGVTAGESGFEIRETECFNRLVQVFKSSESNQVVPLGKITGQNIQSLLSARLFGHVFFFDRSFTATRRV